MKRTSLRATCARTDNPRHVPFVTIAETPIFKALHAFRIFFEAVADEIDVSADSGYRFIGVPIAVPIAVRPSTIILSSSISSERPIASSSEMIRFCTSENSA